MAFDYRGLGVHFMQGTKGDKMKRIKGDRAEARRIYNRLRKDAKRGIWGQAVRSAKSRETLSGKSFFERVKIALRFAIGRDP